MLERFTNLPTYLPANKVVWGCYTRSTYIPTYQEGNMLSKIYLSTNLPTNKVTWDVKIHLPTYLPTYQGNMRLTYLPITKHRKPVAGLVATPQFSRVSWCDSDTRLNTSRAVSTQPGVSRLPSHTRTRTHTPTHTCANTHACTHARTLAQTHTHAHTHACTNTHTCTHARTHVHTHTHTHTHTCTHMRTHTHTHTHTHTCTHMHTHTHTHLHTHTHTHTHRTWLYPHPTSAKHPNPYRLHPLLLPQISVFQDPSPPSPFTAHTTNVCFLVP